MMVYIPDEWFHDIGNRDAVSRILSDIPDTDVLPIGLDPGQDIEKQLSELGEETILKHYQEGYFKVG